MANKLTEREFAFPASAAALVLMNDAAGLGFDFKTLVVFASVSVLYAAIQAWKNAQAMKHGYLKKQ
ncbi:hypothetical protein [uncultured Mediterranean phage]|nr:hypothetical protein [uncultured Mediterranean phage]